MIREIKTLFLLVSLTLILIFVYVGIKTENYEIVDEPQTESEVYDPNLVGVIVRVEPPEGCHVYSTMIGPAGAEIHVACKDPNNFGLTILR